MVTFCYMAELSDYNRDLMACKALKYYLALYRKILLAPGLALQSSSNPGDDEK